MHIGNLIDRHAAYRPRHPAVIFGDHRLDYAQFDRRVNRLANALQKRGVTKGQRIATLLPNCLELLDIYWAAAKTGAVVVPLSPLLLGPGLASLLADSEAVLLFTTDALRSMVEEVKDALPNLNAGNVVLIDGKVPGYANYNDFTQAHEGKPADPKIAPEDIYNIRKQGSVGVPPPFSEMRIQLEDDTPAKPRQIGEIVGRGPLLMPGYFKRPDLTPQTIVDGWLKTGDLGYVDEDGYLYLVDRKKEMIDSGGVKIYPRDVEDVEDVVVRHPDVLEAAVFGIPHEKWGETPLAAVVLRRRSS